MFISTIKYFRHFHDTVLTVTSYMLSNSHTNMIDTDSNSVVLTLTKIITDVSKLLRKDLETIDLAR